MNKHCTQWGFSEIFATKSQPGDFDIAHLCSTLHPSTSLYFAH
jgi:hypothetical protein